MMSCLTIVWIVGMMVWNVEDTYAYNDEPVFLQGIYVEDVDLQGLTMEEATAVINEYIQEISETLVTVQDNNDHVITTTVGELGLEWSNTYILEEALTFGKSGNIIERFKERVDISTSDQVYELELILDETIIQEFLEEHYDEFVIDTVDATLRREGSDFVVVAGTSGYVLDMEATGELIHGILEAETIPSEIGIAAVLIEELPLGTVEELSQITDVMGTYTTSYATSASGRVANVALATSFVNGTVVYPGEEFSTLELLLPFDASKGYEMGGSYSAGVLVQSYGGGVCQVSSTLYNAVLYAELEITERNNHSMTVSYVPKSQDAMIAGSGLDFKFVNNYDYPIYIEGITTDAKQCIFTIYGNDTRDAGRSVELVSEITETIAPGAEVINATTAQGVGYIAISSAYTGYKSRLWKVVYENGVEVERTQVNSSTYKAVARTATVGVATDNPTALAEIQAAIATGSIDYVNAVAAAWAVANAAAAATAVQ